MAEAVNGSKKATESSSDDKVLETVETGGQPQFENQAQNQDEKNRSWKGRIWDFITDVLFEMILLGACRILWRGAKSVIGNLWN